jgi:hypothetical protein
MTLARDLALSAKDLNEITALEWKAFKPKFEAWLEEHGPDFLLSYEAYCRHHGVEP